MNQRDADVIVVGSGFGGAVTACRLAQAGAKVLVLERGRRWTTASYPRAVDDPWLFDTRRPHKKNGGLDVRFFPKMIVAQGAGVGGGSLCYSSVLLQPDARVFDEGWPSQIRFQDLQPHYELVSRMLGEHPQAIDQVVAHQNPQGRWQGTCMHLDNCDIGCDVQAKNTLDLNYIASAENWGADVRPLHYVKAIVTENGGYRVDYRGIADGNGITGSVRAPKVVLAAGSLGTTELLLRCCDELRTLPNLSSQLGSRWSPNGNVLTPAINADCEKVQQTT